MVGFAVSYFWRESTPATLEANLEATIGFIGCSNTAQSIMGYHMVGGDDIWNIPNERKHDFDSGSVEEWANIGNRFWNKFDDYHAANPNTNAVWWQMCVPSNEEPSLEDALEVVSGIKDRIPDVTIYVSALPSYQDGVCRITGTSSGLVRGKELTRELVANSDVKFGPELRPHIKNEIVDDGCHLNDAGMRSVGEQLKQFFDSI